MSENLPSAVRIAAEVRVGRLRARQVAEGALERARATEGLNLFITLDEVGALRAAERIDETVAAGRDPGPLAGVPVAIKDNILTEGLRTTAGSRSLDGFIPPVDATVITRLREAGAVIVGKTNLDEFGMGSSNEHSWFGPAHNPWDRSKVPGGSSGGSAAAVAAGVVPVALGTDTGGSVRQPAAFCGVIGLKPTYGVLSRFGIVAFASSLDQVGVLARSAADARLLMATMSGHDPADATTLPEAPDLSPLDVSGLRIGVVGELSAEGNSPAILAALERTRSALGELAAEVGEAELPAARYGVSTYYLVATAEASSNLSRYDGTIYGTRLGGNELGQAHSMMRTRGAALGKEVRRRVLMGTYALSAGYYDAYYAKALRVRRLIADDFDRAFERFDLLLTPTTPGTAFGLGERRDDPLEMYLGDIATCLANLAGLPAVSVPAGRSEDGLPCGVQLIAPALGERRLLAVAEALAAGGDDVFTAGVAPGRP